MRLTQAAPARMGQNKKKKTRFCLIVFRLSPITLPHLEPVPLCLFLHWALCSYDVAAAGPPEKNKKQNKTKNKNISQLLRVPRLSVLPTG
jgi:hypothetical protein